jgi:hypothetical protein
MAVSAIDKVPVLTGLQERVQDNAGDTSITPGAVLLDRNDQRTATVAQTPVLITTPPATLSAAADTVLTWATTAGEAYSVRRIYIENNSDGGTPATVYGRFDAVANPGGFKIRPGEWRSFDVPCNVLHLYCASALTLNGTTDGGVVVLGWL